MRRGFHKMEKHTMKNKVYTWALEQAPIRYEGDYGGHPDMHNQSSAFLYLAILAHGGDDGARERLGAHIASIAAGENAPGFTAGPFWSYASVSLAIAVAHRTPAVWDALDADTRARLNLIMECYAIASAFVSNDCNDYCTGPSLSGNHRKTWNPNHRMAMVIPILAASVYFGSDGADGAAAVDAILTGFDYDAYLARFDAYGFVRAKDYWTTEGITLPDGTVARSARLLMTEGGDAYLSREDHGTQANKLQLGRPLGTGRGVPYPFVYHGIPLFNLRAILEDLYAYNYSGGKVISDTANLPRGLDENGKPLCYIEDGTRSPVEGMEGMMYELVSADAGGIRSSTSYCAHDFLLVVQSLAALHEIGVYIPDYASELWSKIVVGNTDVVYKLEHGYRGYSIGKSYGYNESRIPAYFPWKHLWLEKYAK